MGGAMILCAFPPFPPSVAPWLLCTVRAPNLLVHLSSDVQAPILLPLFVVGTGRLGIGGIYFSEDDDDEFRAMLLSAFFIHFAIFC